MKSPVIWIRAAGVPDAHHSPLRGVADGQDRGSERCFTSPLVSEGPLTGYEWHGGLLNY